MKINDYRQNSYIEIKKDSSFKGESSDLQATQALNTDLVQKPHDAAQTEDKKHKKFDLPVFVSTMLGAVVPIIAIRKYQGKALKAGALKDMDFAGKAKTFFKSLNIKYELKEMLLISFGSVAGGLFGGLVSGKKEDKKSKVKESVFQALNVAIPTTLVATLLDAAEKSKKAKGILPKIAAVVLGIGVGMPSAAILSNDINSSVIDRDNQQQRKLSLKDCFVHIDDLLGALVLAKIPFADKLHVEKILPALYMLCGYEAGSKKAEPKV